MAVRTWVLSTKRGSRRYALAARCFGCPEVGGGGTSRDWGCCCCCCCFGRWHSTWLRRPLLFLLPLGLSQRGVEVKVSERLIACKDDWLQLQLRVRLFSLGFFAFYARLAKNEFRCWD
ncbi:unnamed protein product, partial [Ectocarpus fasciculatus]